MFITNLCIYLFVLNCDVSYYTVELLAKYLFKMKTLKIYLKSDVHVSLGCFLPTCKYF